MKEIIAAALQEEASIFPLAGNAIMGEIILPGILGMTVLDSFFDGTNDRESARGNTNAKGLINDNENIQMQS